MIRHRADLRAMTALVVFRERSSGPCLADRRPDSPTRPARPTLLDPLTNHLTG